MLEWKKENEEMVWIKIDRDKDGFATNEILNKIAKLHEQGIPIVLLCGDTYDMISPEYDICGWCGDIDRDTDYTHYFPIPKFQDSNVKK